MKSFIAGVAPAGYFTADVSVFMAHLPKSLFVMFKNGRGLSLFPHHCLGILTRSQRHVLMREHPCLDLVGQGDSDTRRTSTGAAGWLA